MPHPRPWEQTGEQGLMYYYHRHNCCPSDCIYCKNEGKHIKKEGVAMKTIKGWWFAPKDKKLANGDGRKIKIGTTHKVKGEIIPCRHGLHLSKRLIDALKYAPGPVVYRVVGSGTIISHGDPIDKYACSERTYIDGGVDCSDVLRQFARLCALDVVHLWDAPPVVVEYLKTGSEEIRDAARAVARDAVRDATRAASWDAARAVARDTSWVASWVASWDAARDAARAVARVASWDAVRAVARDAARSKQNKRLTSMIVHKLKKCV